MSAELVAIVLVGTLVLAICLVLLRWVRATSQRVYGIDRVVRRSRRDQARRLGRLERRTADLEAALRQERADLASVRAELAAATEASREQHRRVTTSMRDGLDRAVRDLRRAGADDVAQVEALLQLLPLADLREPIPRTRIFPASPDALLVLVDLVRRERPRFYLELGSGTSTVVVASAARVIGLDLKVVAVEHDAEYADQTRQLARRHGLADLVEVRHAPLVPLDGEVGRQWYDPAALSDVSDVNLCFVDGPPGAAGPSARQPALQVVPALLADRAFVVVDDSARPDERALADAWAQHPDVVEVVRPLAEKGLDILRVQRTPQ